MIITNAALRGREGTWDIHIENANFGSIVASPADSDNRDGSSDADLFDAGRPTGCRTLRRRACAPRLLEYRRSAPAQ